MDDCLMIRRPINGATAVSHTGLYQESIPHSTTMNDNTGTAYGCSSDSFGLCKTENTDTHCDSSVVGGAGDSVCDTTVNNNDLPSDEKEEPEIDISINNVVCAFGLRCHLNLKEIAKNGCHVEYRKENSMLNMKLRKPVCTASIWSSGKVTVTGATSEDAAYQSARRIGRRIQRLGFKVTFCNYRIVNVLATCSFPFGINIRSFSDSHRPKASYEPEIHPAVTYRIPSPKATLKIFSTGSITVTGPCVGNVQAAIEYIYPLVEEFKTAYDPRPEYGEHRHVYRSLKQQHKTSEYQKHRITDSSDDDRDDDVLNDDMLSDDDNFASA